MIEKIKEQVEKNPNNIAYIVDNEKITYKELYEKALFYSNYLKKEGSNPVIIYGNKEIDVLIAMIACILSKRAYINIDYNTPIERIKTIKKMTKSNLIISNKKIEDLDCLKLDELKIIGDRKELKNDNDIIYIISTSGTTGIPKLVPINNTNLNNFINWISNLDDLSQYKNINVLNTASFSFDLSVTDIFYSLCNGHTLITFNKNINEFDELFHILKDIDMIVLTPTFLKLLLLNKDFNNINYKRLKCIYSCGERLEAKLAKKIMELFPNIKIINAYGPTETTSAVSAIRITKDMLNKELLPVGNINNLASEIEIKNDEIIIKGDSVFNGYLSNNSSGFFIDKSINCYKTGDIGYIKNDLLYIKGRKDSQIKYKGYRIELNEIESNINSIDGVKDSVVIAKYNNLSVKSIKAFIITEKDIKIDYIKQELKNKIPSYMIPKSIEFIEKFPINKNGKIDRKALCSYD